MQGSGRFWKVSNGSGAWGKQRLIVQPGENRLDLTLDQGSHRQEIRGRFVAPDGEDDYMYNVWAKKEGYAPGRAAEAVRVAGSPVEGIEVRFSAGANTGGGAYSRADGSFRALVEDGTYRVWTLREGYARAFLEEPVTVEGAPVDGIELRLGETGTVRGRILGLEPGERARDVWAAGPGGPVRQGQLDQEGGFVIDGLPPGDWTILARYGDREGVATVSLATGQSETWTEVEMEAAPEAALAKPKGQGTR